MSIYEATPYDHTLRRLTSSVFTLTAVAEFLEDVENVEDVKDRGDLLVAVENLIDVAVYVTERGRELAWQFAPLPEESE